MYFASSLVSIPNVARRRGVLGGEGGRNDREEEREWEGGERGERERGQRRGGERGKEWGIGRKRRI